MIMKKASIVLVVGVVILGVAALYWVYLKAQAANLANVYSTTWNEAGTCYINSYIPRYSALGVAGKLASLFTSEAFFRVYTKDGELLKSSEWLLWQNEFTTDERSQWVGGRAIYPTADGYEGWIIPECK